MVYNMLMCYLRQSGLFTRTQASSVNVFLFFFNSQSTLQTPVLLVAVNLGWFVNATKHLKKQKKKKKKIASHSTSVGGGNAPRAGSAAAVIEDEEVPLTCGEFTVRFWD